MQLEMGQTPIETVFIQPTKDMPFKFFKQCHHLSMFMELMDRLPDGRVIWDETRETLVSETSAEAEYYGLQNDYFTMTMELPKEFIEQ